MIRLAFFGLVVVVAVIIWIAKLAAGAVTSNPELENTTFKDQTKRTMNDVARGINWLESEWEKAKAEAARKDDLAAQVDDEHEQ